MATVKGDKQCNRCTLCETAQSVCLMGRGPIPCEIMIVGEAPGYREDDIGKPFAGKAGKVLEEMLSSIGLSRDRVYITNAVRCRPPENRTPTAREIRACSVWMEREFEEVRPRFVLLLGSTPLKALIGRARITEERGRMIERDRRFYFPTFHPAACLYDETKREVIATDFRSFKRMIEQIRRGKSAVENDFSWTLVMDIETLQRALDDIRDSRSVVLDLETSGLSPWRDDSAVVILGLGTKNHQWVIPLDHRESPFRRTSLQNLIVTAINEVVKDKYIITQNGKFDTLWMRVKFGVDWKVSFDTIIADHLLNEDHPHGLKYLASLYFGAPNYDIPTEIKKGGGSLKELALYNALDLYYTRRVKKKLKAELKSDDGQALWTFFRKVMMPACNVFRDIEYNGIYVDQTKLEDAEKYWIEKLAEIESKISEVYPSDKRINWRSPQQVAQILFDELGLDPLEETKSGDPSTSESVLKRLRGKHPLPALILEHREACKQLSAFINSWKSKLTGGYLHPTFNLWGARTGRLSCKEPNLQQVPRDKRIRSLLTAPSGWTMVEADFSQIELRVAAMLANERNMKLAFQTNQDIHLMTARAVLGKEEITKEERKKAKAINFGFLYGMGYKKFQEYARDKYEMDLDLSECKRFRKRFFDLYPDLPAWHDRQRRIVRAQGYVRSLTGRIRHLPNAQVEDESLRAEAERQAINSPVQGFASDLTLMAVIALSEEFDPETFKIHGTVHDAILMSIRNDKIKEYIPRIHQIMVHPPLLDELHIHMTVPIEVEINLGPWGGGVPWQEVFSKNGWKVGPLQRS